MFDMKEKLIEILTAYFGVDPAYYGIEARHLADNLIANGVTVQKWIPVTERLPEHGDVVLICTKDKDVQVFQWDAVYNGWVGDRYNYSVKYVTHWMPLPDAPKGE